MSAGKNSDHNLETTGYNCGACNRPDHADGMMVSCDNCSTWFHFSCVGVKEDIHNTTWHCKKCTDRKILVQGIEDIPSESVIDLGLDSPDDAWKAHERDQAKAELKHKRELEQMREIQRRNFQRQLQRENEKRMVQLELEREMLEMKRAAEEEFQKKRSSMWLEYRQEPIANEHGEFVSTVAGWTQCNVVKEVAWKDKQQDPTKQKLEENVPSDFRGAYPKISTPNSSKQRGESTGNNQLLRKPDLHTKPRNRDDSPSKESSASKISHRIASNSRRSLIYESDDCGSDCERIPQWDGDLTKTQLAARKGPFQKLPIFTGKPEEWPLFISSFQNGNQACNWSDLENLGRLQESIKGPALDAVRSRLLLPESVPQVIETLRLLYGRPEQLLHTLLSKARKADPPRIERLSSFISFGMILQQLCDHLVAAGLRSHLINPMLIQELVEKLPSSTKLEWVRYKRQQPEVTLKTFSDFLSQIVSEASEVTLFTESFSELGNRSGKVGNDRKRKEKEAYVHTHIGISEPLLNQRSSDTDTIQKFESRESNRKPCRICNRIDHRVRYCEDFGKLTFQERMKAVEKWKLCQLCLNEHGQSRCRFKLQCNVGNCRDKHHPLLHPPNRAIPLRTAECNAHNAQSQQPVIFRMVPISLHNGNHSLNVIAFLDEGSSYSLIERRVANELKLDGVSQPILVKWTAGMTRLERESKCLHLSISNTNSAERFMLRNVHTVEQLQLPEQKLQFADIAARYQHLRGLPVTDYRHGAPRILIGLKHLHVYAPLESRIGNPGEPIAVRTRLGWTVYGPQSEDDATDGFTAHHAVGPTSDQDLHDLIRSHYTLEESGISVTVLPESADDRRARNILDNTTVRVGDRFKTGLLWRIDDPHLPDSFPMALRRMKNLENKLSKNPELKQIVEKQIDDYLRKGYCHKATSNDLASKNNGKVWYLPLNVVLNPKKPNKIRLVWDASATVQGTSLNSILLKGPDMLASLPAVISRFQERRVAFGGDIKEMYHQLMIQESDKQAQRFLFRQDPASQPDTYVMDVATFGSTSSPCSAQYVKNRNAQDYSEQFPDAVEAIVNGHYVDDYFDSTDTIAEAVKRATEVKHIHSKAGFQIRNWVSNSEEFLNHMGEPREEQVIHFNTDKTNSTERVLGMSWNPTDDVFVFSTKLRDDLEPFVSGKRRPTKRKVLSCVMSLFDPLGLLAPFTIFGKMIIQDLWRSGCCWDDEIDDETAVKWNRWTSLMPQIEALKIPRCYFPDTSTENYESLQLHIFTDASENAYGCVAYFRAVINGQPKCALVAAKSKVAPLQYMSIPRLELQAVVLGARLSNMVKDNHSLKIDKRILWTDSTTVLSWIRSDHKIYRQYVAHRIGEVMSLASVDEWRRIPTKLNIADTLTKWGSGPPLTNQGQWVVGPNILLQFEEQWPNFELPALNVREELRACHLYHEIEFLEPLVDTKRISKWPILVRSVACVYRFITNCRKKGSKSPIQTFLASANQARLIKRTIPAIVASLTREEYRKAEIQVFKIAQQDAYEDELKVLLKNKELLPGKLLSIDQNSELYQLSPLLDEDQVIRMEGRSAYADFMPFDLRFPIVLPKGHDVTKKLLNYYHQKFGHCNRETVVNEFRQRFYVSQLRAVVWQVIKDCTWCKVHKCRPSVPRMAPLPIQRLTPNLRPFIYVGVDYFGPISVSVGRRSEKKWVALFTCMTTRAIHMEVAHSLSSPACIMAIRRFICRRGLPLEIFSDNGTNFQAASKEIAGEFQKIHRQCAETFTDARTQWSFNPPSAPHMGGCWERLVRSAKEALKVVDDGRKLTDEILLTVLAEAEDIINSRPLTYVPQKSADSEALTPNHFLRGYPPGEHPMGIRSTDPASALRDDYKRSQLLADVLWQRWLKEYIPGVNRRPKWHEERQPIEVGELVYIVDGGKRRAWTRGIVDKVMRGKDGRIRQAMVRTASGVFRRPVAKLAALELQSKSGRTENSEPVLRAGEMLAPQGTTD
ncbi:uncharacterized protein LOC131681180 [Topomyia yanbarensis]|uniref:uncharacterized protein LOC131681180 n=1 Tax=Topomyia yanbarensis TaxID=2498891 RepID=UPI00273AB47B|nr:uncharacterized protein LOC131681180 [Topomyia yanbarensis]